jgi:hypothetical protein
VADRRPDEDQFRSHHRVQDVLLAPFGVFAYMGDYISVAVDATKTRPGQSRPGPTTPSEIET